MSDARDDFSAGVPAPGSSRLLTDDAASQVAPAEGTRSGHLGGDADSGCDTHTMLARPPASQGRRSLFRR